MVSLVNLFGSQELLLLRPASTEIDAEAVLMEALADAAEDEQLDENCKNIEY